MNILFQKLLFANSYRDFDLELIFLMVSAICSIDHTHNRCSHLEQYQQTPVPRKATTGVLDAIAFC